MALVPKVVQAILGQGRGFDKRFRGVLGRFQGAVPALCFQLVTEPGFLVTQDATVRLVSNGAQFLLDLWCPMEYKKTCADGCRDAYLPRDCQ
jgi:hypothetical protein